MSGITKMVEWLESMCDLDFKNHDKESASIHMKSLKQARHLAQEEAKEICCKDCQRERPCGMKCWEEAKENDLKWKGPNDCVMCGPERHSCKERFSGNCQKPTATSSLVEIKKELDQDMLLAFNPLLLGKILGTISKHLSRYRPQTDVVGEPPIVIWDKCELHHEPGDYEAGVGDEWWIDSCDGEFQTGLSVIGWPSSDFFPAKGRLVFIPEPGLTQKALDAIKKDEEYWESEGQKLGAQLDLISDKYEGEK